MNMANVLPIAKRVSAISALAEGSGIRQGERMTGVLRRHVTVLHVGPVTVLHVGPVTVLHVGPVTSPLEEAARAAIVQEFRNAQTETSEG
jgi:hypothetical protein